MRVPYKSKKEILKMFYASELEFFRRILGNLHIDTCIFPIDGKIPEKIDRGIRSFLGLESEYERFFSESLKRVKPNKILNISDDFFSNYIFISLPESEPESVFIAGPYVYDDVTHEMLETAAEKFHLPSAFFYQIEKYFSSLPTVTNENTLNSLFDSLGELLWGSLDSFSFETVCLHLPEKTDLAHLPPLKEKPDNPMLAIHILEQRYEMERKLMQAVSQGQTHKVEQIINGMSSLAFEKRTDNPVRNFKNYLIVTNTLLRKAAEYGAVHPFYIDALSTDFAIKIEKIRTLSEASDMMSELMHKYCTLVKKHSMKNYSLPVQKVLTAIDSDLTADLSLHSLAEIFNINASYLSSLFKRETGKTLTDYVSHKRIEHAAYLLQTTNLQIQVVAQHCGIFDVNYFAKMFKKYMGKTPKEYREKS